MFIDAMLRLENKLRRSDMSTYRSYGDRNQLHQLIYKHSVPTGLLLFKLLVQSPLFPLPYLYSSISDR